MTTLDIIAPTTITLGEYTFTLKNFRRVSGHDDSLPYTATIYVNGKRTFKAFNDGWGGETNFLPVDKAGVSEQTINDYLDGDKFPWCTYADVTLYYNRLACVADKLADNADLRKTFIKMKKKGKALAYNILTGEICTAPRALIADYILNKGYTLIYNEDGSEVEKAA